MAKHERDLIKEFISAYNAEHKPFLLIDNTQDDDKKISSFIKEEENMQYNGIKIRRRKDGRWEAQKQINGEKINITKNTQREVYEELKLLFPKVVEKKQKSKTLHEYIDYWYKTYKEPFLTKERKNNYKCVINNQIKPYFKDKDIKLFTTHEINLIIKNIPNTRLKEDATQFLRNIFKMAFKEKHIKSNFYEEITKYQHKREEGVALTKSQRRSVIDKCKNIDEGEVFVFYMYTGARASEILNINPKTDITNDMIHFPGTKTDLSDRWIPIFEPIKNILRNKDLTSDRLFKMSYTTLKRKIMKLRELCGFHINIKDLRTTFGTICAEMKINEKTIAKWMGHSSTKTTQKYYIKVLPEFEKQEAEKINQSFCGTFDGTFLTKTKIKYKRCQYMVYFKNKIYKI